MEIRLRGTVEECTVMAGLLSNAVRVLSVSKPYPDRGSNGIVRVFLDVRAERSQQAPAHTHAEVIHPPAIEPSRG